MTGDLTVAALQMAIRRELVTRAVQAVRNHLAGSEHTMAVVVDFLAELEEWPNQSLQRTR